MSFSFLAALGAGFLLFLPLNALWVKDRELRQFWALRVGTAVLMGLLLWKLTPLWTRWNAVLDHPLALLSMNGGLAAVFGGLFAGLGVAAVSLFQVKFEKKGHPRWPLVASASAGLGLAAALALGLPLILPHPGSTPGAAAEASVPDLDGLPHSLADAKGKVVVVNFWATWCPPCQAELPEFQDYWKTPPPGVVLVGVDLIGTEKGGLGAVQSYTRDNKMGWTQLTDPDGVLQRAFAVTSVPTTVVLDGQGRVVDRREGAVDLLWLKGLAGRFGP